MQKIENVILDLGGVILNIDYNLTRSAFERLGVADFDEMYSQQNANILFRNLEKGLIDDEDFYQQLNQITGLHLSHSQIDEAWNAMLLDFRESTLSFLNELKSRCNLYLFSNTNHIHIRAFRNIYHQKNRPHPFDDYFIKAYYSCEIGYRKPDINAYEWLLKDISSDAGNALFIDDTLQNVVAAQDCGMKALHLQPIEKLENLDWDLFI